MHVLSTPSTTHASWLMTTKTLGTVGHTQHLIKFTIVDTFLRRHRPCCPRLCRTHLTLLALNGRVYWPRARSLIVSCGCTDDAVDHCGYAVDLLDTEPTENIPHSMADCGHSIDSSSPNITDSGNSIDPSGPNFADGGNVIDPSGLYQWRKTCKTRKSSKQ